MLRARHGRGAGGGAACTARLRARMVLRPTLVQESLELQHPQVALARSAVDGEADRVELVLPHGDALVGARDQQRVHHQSPHLAVGVAVARCIGQRGRRDVKGWCCVPHTSPCPPARAVTTPHLRGAQ